MKNTEQKNPTAKFYGLFQYIFDYYNEQLFSNQIKNCVIAITRKNQTMGYFDYKRWFNLSDENVDELALNPTMFIQFPLIEICQTMVHEMCHAWQYHYGKPGTSGYHNKEWANKMISLGLMPSSTGRIGGEIVGKKMADYPIKSGTFLKVSKDLMDTDVFSELYLEVNLNIASLLDTSKPLFEQIKELTLAQGQTKPNKKKTKYSCACSNVWGKPNLEMVCKLCNNDFISN